MEILNVISEYKRKYNVYKTDDKGETRRINIRPKQGKKRVMAFVRDTKDSPIRTAHIDIDK